MDPEYVMQITHVAANILYKISHPAAFILITYCMSVINTDDKDKVRRRLNAILVFKTFTFPHLHRFFPSNR